MLRYSEKLHFPRLDRKRVRSKRVPPAARRVGHSEQTKLKSKIWSLFENL